MRPFRFGVGASSLAADPPTWTDYARRIEDLGYSVLTIGDHPSFRWAGPLTALTAAALRTTTLRVGTYVLANDFRHPLVLAREVATLDQLSEGRVELGVGAGWLETDHAALGIRFEPASTRIARLEEALQLLELAFSGEPFAFHGQHYTIEGAEGFPLPRQRPRPPLVVGGGGMGVLRVAARHADVVALSHRFDGGARHLTGPSVTSSTWSATRAKVDVVRAAAGDRFPDIELGVLVQQVTVTDDVAGAAASVAKTVGASPEDVLGSPCYLVGEVPAIVERLQMQREAVGISYVTVVAGDADRFAPVVRELSGR